MNKLPADILLVVFLRWDERIVVIIARKKCKLYGTVEYVK